LASAREFVNWAEQCVVVIPCLNEASRIGNLVKSIRSRLPLVLVVDDGSRDGTGKVGAEAGARVLRHEVSLGKGAALQDGWKLAAAWGARWVLSLDGDGQHAPEDIPLFLEAAEKTGAALIVGNRMDRPGVMPWVRSLTNRFMSWKLSRLAGCALPDTQCGYRLMYLDAWSALNLKTAHFEFESELLIAMARAGFRIEFIPIQVIYGDERSKIHPLRDTWRWFRWLRRWR
jgi:glycosyltransferase involved in cell wall biosynthesis